MKIQVVCVMTPCRLVNSYPRSGGARCQHLQGQAVHAKQSLYYMMALINFSRSNALLLHCLRAYCFTQLIVE